MDSKLKCKVCGSTNLVKAIDLGPMPSPNKLLSKPMKEQFLSFPLRYYWCPVCSFFQQIELVDSKKLFEEDYTYQTGVSLPAVEHFISLAKDIDSKITSKKFALVIASNDGTETKVLREELHFEYVLGVEPARNLAETANSKNLPTINAFFTKELSSQILKDYGHPDLILANNVFAHVPDPRGFLEGVRNLLTPESVAIIEVQWLKDFVKKVAIEMLYAEHFYVWSAKAMKVLAKDVDLSVVEIQPLRNQQGGSLRYWIKLQGTQSTTVDQEEKISGIWELRTIRKLQGEAEKRKERFRTQIIDFKRQGRVIDIWAVPAKVVTILNFFSIDNSLIRRAYDLTPTKIGKYIPKANIPIYDEKLLREEMTDPPDYLIVGAWNYLDFARSKLKWFTKSGGRLINLLDGSIITE